MLNIYKHTQTKPKPKPTFNYKNRSYVCAYHCVQLPYTTQHRTVDIFHSYPPDNHTAGMMSTGGEGECTEVLYCS